MSGTKKIGLALLVAFIGIQFIQPAYNKNDQVLTTDISKTLNITDSVHTILKNACYDCHSNNTGYPWYAYVQPLGWMLNNHILNGKKVLNFSEFGSYSARKKQSKLKSIASQINDAAMPLSSYTLMHKTARLSKEDKALIVNWAEQSIDNIMKKNK